MGVVRLIVRLEAVLFHVKRLSPCRLCDALTRKECNDYSMSLKGTGYARSEDDWMCIKCKRTHRQKTSVCQCGAIPQYRKTVKARRLRIAAHKLGLNWPRGTGADRV